MKTATLRRLSALLAGACLLLALSACGPKTPPEPSGKPPLQIKLPTAEQPVENPKPELSEEPAKPVAPALFFAGPYLLGKLDENGWHSLNDANGIPGDGIGNPTVFYAQDLLNSSSYSVYDKQGKIGDAAGLLWVNEVYTPDGFQDEYTAQVIFPYGEPFAFEGNDPSYTYLFKLPMKLGMDALHVRIPDTNGFASWMVAADGTVLNVRQWTFATDAKTVTFPQKMEEDVPVPDGAADALARLFKNSGIGGCAPHFTQCIRLDVDGDGEMEYLLAANTESSESEYMQPVIRGEGTRSDVGSFSALLLMESDGSVQPLETIFRPVFEPVTFRNGEAGLQDIEHFHFIEIQWIADLTGDGRMEIVSRTGEWEWGHYSLFSSDQEGRFRPVLRSDWGV